MQNCVKLDQYLNRREAAKFLGVTPATLTNWEKKRSKKLRVYRHPITDFPIYRKEDLERFLREI